jgi:hypothetical protein
MQHHSEALNGRLAMFTCKTVFEIKQVTYSFACNTDFLGTLPIFEPSDGNLYWPLGNQPLGRHIAQSGTKELIFASHISCSDE